MKSKERNGYRFILMALLKEKSLSLRELEEKSNILSDQFYTFGINLAYNIIPSRLHLDKDLHRRRDRKHEKDFDVESECENLIKKNMIILNKENKYELTEKGRKTAIESAEEIEKLTDRIEKKLLSPSAAARNTVIVDFFLAVMKLLAGFLSGSVGLIADGADATVDTVSASLVWIGIKYKKEFLGTLIIIAMMFVTSISVGYESITKILQAITSEISPISMPYLVIIVEGIALISAAILYFYQRYVGKRNGSLALISQSIDSKNHIYVAVTIIIGAIFSIFGIHFVDALIGAFIAIRILIDGIGLLREVFSSIKGEEIDFSKYEIPFEKKWHLSRLETFRSWILYSIKEDDLKTRNELVTALERTFKPRYVPILSEFKFSLGEDFDFEGEFDNLIKPMLDEKLLIKEGDRFILTGEGKKRVDKVFSSMRYHQSK